MRSTSDPASMMRNATPDGGSPCSVVVPVTMVPRQRIDGDLVAVAQDAVRIGATDDRQADIHRVAIEDARKARGDDRCDTVALDRQRRVLA